MTPIYKLRAHHRFKVGQTIRIISMRRAKLQEIDLNHEWARRLCKITKIEPDRSFEVLTINGKMTSYGGAEYLGYR